MTLTLKEQRCLRQFGRRARRNARAAKPVTRMPRRAKKALQKYARQVMAVVLTEYRRRGEFAPALTPHTPEP